MEEKKNDTEETKEVSENDRPEIINPFEKKKTNFFDENNYDDPSPSDFIDSAQDMLDSMKKGDLSSHLQKNGNAMNMAWSMMRMTLRTMDAKTKFRMALAIVTILYTFIMGIIYMIIRGAEFPNPQSYLPIGVLIYITYNYAIVPILDTINNKTNHNK